MRRIGGLWESLVNFDNLHLAYRRARRGKCARSDVARFILDVEGELLRLQNELCEGTYRPGAYRQFTIYERKPRIISAAPFRDRVVHHAVMNLIEAPLDRRLIDDTYACRKGKGVHAAVDRYQTYAKKYSYVLKLDIRQYFPSIDHLILKQTIRRRIKDDQLLNLLDLIIDNGPESKSDPVYFPGDALFTPFERRTGIPIGNLTSQFFANLFLDDFDHWLKETLQAPAYIRYVDDLFLFGNDKSLLWQWRSLIAKYLANLRLLLHERKAQIYRTSDWVDVLGYIVKPTRRRLRGENARHFAKRLKGLAAAYRCGTIDLGKVRASVHSWIGHAAHADTLGLRKVILSGVKFQRETT